MAKKKTATILKNASKAKALEALHEVEELIDLGEPEEAFDMLRNEYRIGPETHFGTHGRTFLFMMRELFQWTEDKSKETEENALVFIKKFIESAADVNHQDKFGATLLHLAAWECYSEICRLLLDKGARTDIVDEVGHTALDEAIDGYYKFYATRKDECVSVLLLGGADPERPFEGNDDYRTPLERVYVNSLVSNPTAPENNRLRKIFFGALDQVKSRRASQLESAQNPSSTEPIPFNDVVGKTMNDE